MIGNYLDQVGFLRAVMMLATLLLIFLSPFAGGHIQTSGWPLVTTLLAPVCFAIFVFVLCLDMLMTRVFMSDRSDTDRRRFIMIIRSEALLLGLLLLSWAPFVWELMQARPI